MKKNVASQRIGAQMITASDGSNFTGAVTVYVTVDAGTQAAGSVGSGACTHEGKGYHTYAPAQAETNGDLVAFTFEGAGAITATVQVYTSFPQAGDAYAEAVNGTYGLSAIKTQTAAIEADTTVIGAEGAGLTAIPWNASWDAEVQSEVNDGLVAYGAASTTNIVSGTITTVGTVNGLAAGVITAASIAADAITAAKVAADVTTEIQSGLATAANLATVAGYLDTEIAAILADTSELQADWANGGRLDLILDARASQASVDDLPTNAGLATALGTADDAVLAAVAALPTATQNADALLNRDRAAVAVTNARSPINALRFLRNKWSIADGTLTVTQEDDATSAWTATVTTAAGNPASGIDPA